MTERGVYLHPLIEKYLDELVATGLFGNDANAVMARLIEEGIERRLVNGLRHVRPIKFFGSTKSKDESSASL